MKKTTDKNITSKFKFERVEEVLGWTERKRKKYISELKEHQKYATEEETEFIKLYLEKII